MLSRQKIIRSFSGNIVETALGFSTIFFATRAYEQSEAGAYFVALAVISILNNLKEGFLQNGFVKFLVESHFDRQVIQTGFASSLIWEIGKIAFFAGITAVYQPLWDYLIPYCSYTLTYSTYRLLVFIHKSRFDLKEIVVGNSWILAATLLGLGVIYQYHLPIESIFYATGLGYLLAAIFVHQNRKLILNHLFRSYNREVLKKINRFGKYGLLKEVSGSIAHQAGIFISAYFLSLESTAILGIATRYSILIAIPGASLAGILYPVILRAGSDPLDLVLVSKQGIAKMYALMLPLAFLISLASPAAIYLLHGSEYMEAIPILIVKLLASTFLIPLGSGFASMMNAINRPGEITRLMMISSLTNIIGSIIFIYYFGIWGAAIAPVLTEILGAYIIRKKLLHTLGFDVLSLPLSIQFYWMYWINQYTIKPWKKFKYQS